MRRHVNTMAPGVVTGTTGRFRAYEDPDGCTREKQMLFPMANRYDGSDRARLATRIKQIDFPVD
jgi:hypothetical protein